MGGRHLLVCSHDMQGGGDTVVTAAPLRTTQGDTVHSMYYLDHVFEKARVWQLVEQTNGLVSAVEVREREGYGRGRERVL